MENSQNAEGKLDQDFLFYLSFTEKYFHLLKSSDATKMCKAWLNRLCGERITGMYAKRVRNIYLSRLILKMQEGTLDYPFNEFPPSGPLENIFDQNPPVDINVTNMPEPKVENDEAYISRDGRTYLATRSLEDGRAAFGYLAVTLNDGDAEWFPQAGAAKFDAAMKEQFEYGMGDVSKPDLATVLASRKTKEQRDGVMSFYEELLENIDQQINGEVPQGSSDAVLDLVKRLVAGLKCANRYGELKKLSQRERYFTLLEMLADKIRVRITRIQNREVLLDDIEHKLVSNTFLDESIRAEDFFRGKSWLGHVPMDPFEEKIHAMKYKYPPELIYEFLELLLKEKYSLGRRARNRHEKLVSQMKRELRMEREKGAARCESLLTSIGFLHTALELVNTGELTGRHTRDKLLNEMRQSQQELQTILNEGKQLMKEADDWTKLIQIRLQL